MAEPSSASSGDLRLALGCGCCSGCVVVPVSLALVVIYVAYLLAHPPVCLAH